MNFISNSFDILISVLLLCYFSIGNELKKRREGVLLLIGTHKFQHVANI